MHEQFHIRILRAALIAMMGLAWFGPANRALAQINALSPTTSWLPVLYGDGGFDDPGGDQSTGSSESDIIGNTNHASFYTSFWNGGTSSATDGQIGFRIRLAAEKSPGGYSHIAFVGVDGNADGRLDLFLGVDNQGSGNYLRIWKGSAGAGLNISPGTLSIDSTPVFSSAQAASNYSWVVVDSAIDPLATNFNIDGATGANEVDRFLTFVIPFADLVTAFTQVGITNFTDASPVNYVVGTSTQPNNVNQDLNGMNGGLSSTNAFIDLGILTQTYTVDGTLVPEPGTIAFAAVAIGGIALFRARRRR